MTLTDLCIMAADQAADRFGGLFGLDAGTVAGWRDGIAGNLTATKTIVAAFALVDVAIALATFQMRRSVRRIHAANDERFAGPGVDAHRGEEEAELAFMARYGGRPLRHRH